ncbi:MAG TPA: CRISPR-associated protein Cas5, partial [Leptospiraceae bacterium]|nr:CRISPR-associated protein Cas5 [Leptospiraceae bacterium]
MEEFYIHVKAPFAAYRYFQAGNYRVTMPTMPHSAAYGLILNLAGIEMRKGLNELTTLIKDVVREYSFQDENSVPSLKISIGDIDISKKGSVFQQLHDYPP